MRKRTFLIAALLLLTNVRMFAQALFDEGAKPMLVSRQFAFTEGPAVDKQGNIFFTDQPNNHIWKYDINGKLSIFMDKAGRANGMYFDTNGNLIACADEHNQVWQISPNKKIKVLLTAYEGKLFNGPNDLWINKKDNVYFTDPYYQRDYWSRTKPDLSKQSVYVLMKGQSKPVVLDNTLKQPNGIVGSPDGKTLYVANIGDGKTYKYTINPNGLLSDRQLFFDKGADGITLDERGNLYLAGNGIMVVNPQGQEITHIAIPEPWTANICFGGKNRDKLFITSSKAVYIMQMKVKGVE